MTTAWILGTGFWAREAHLVALRELDVALTACVGRTRERAESFARANGIPAGYGSLEELMAREPRPDVLIVAGPDDVHPAATDVALKAGIPVFCEKPLANEAAVADEMARLAESTGTPATVGYSFRYGPAVQALRRDLQSGVLGVPWLLELFEYNAQFHPASGKPMNWKGDPERARAGALYEYASHVVDIADWLAGPIGSVSATLSSVLPGSRLDDIATLQLRLRPPAIGVLVASWTLSGSIPGIRIRLHGSKRLAEVELSETLATNQAYRRYALDGTVTEEVELEPLGDPRAGYAKRHLEDFLALVEGRPSDMPGTLPSLRDGARIQAVLETALGATDRWAAVYAG